jgi:phosphate transport system substrate-binding protein
LLTVLKGVTICSQITVRKGFFWAIYAYVVQSEAIESERLMRITFNRFLIISISTIMGLLLLTAILGGGLRTSYGADAITIQGSGATFPAPLYQLWFSEFNKTHPDVQINYQAIGSGAGIKQFQSGLTDFGASDAAMTDEQMAATKNGVQLIPMTAGIIVLTYNLPGAPSDLKLSRDAYAGIFLGKITSWNDPAIAKSNPNVQLPATKITVVSRSDGSGTTYVFTSHLSAISDAWKNGPGHGTTVNFPVGVGGKGNPGVTALVKQTPGAIGYVEYAYAKQNNLPMAVLENKSGGFIPPSLQAGQEALGSVDLPSNLRACSRTRQQRMRIRSLLTPGCFFGRSTTIHKWRIL